METREEVMQGRAYDNRVDFLLDMDIGQIMELFPDEDAIKRVLIEAIIEATYDKQINEEVK